MAYFFNRGTLGAVAAVVGIVTLATYASRRGAPAAGALDAVPADSFLVATLDVDALRRSPLFAAVFGNDAGRVFGFNELTESCGFDPMTRVRELSVAVPEEGDRGDFGVAARVEVTRDEIGACTKRLIEQRGGHAETRTASGFTILEEKEGSRGRLAYREGSGISGIVLAGRGAWVDAMIEASDGRRASIAKSVEHAQLRGAIAAREGWKSPTLIVTALLPKGLRDRMRKQMGAELDSLSAGQGDSSSAIMAGVLGVSSAGFALRAGTVGGQLDAALELRCETADGCATVGRLLRAKRLEASRDLGLRLVGLGPLVDSFDVETSSTALRATVSAPADDIARAIERLLTSRQRSAPVEKKRLEAPAPSTSGAPSFSGEVVRPKPESSAIPH